MSRDLFKKARETISDLRAQLATVTKERDELRAALSDAVHELNQIRARDGVPYPKDGSPPGVTEEYFDSVVEKCYAALGESDAAAALQQEDRT